MAERKSVSMQDLADKLGISKVTVSKALNGKDGVGEELKEKIFALARESGYVFGLRKTEEQKSRYHHESAVQLRRQKENFIWQCTSGSSTSCREHPVRVS